MHAVIFSCHLKFWSYKITFFAINRTNVSVLTVFYGLKALKKPVLQTEIKQGWLRQKNILLEADWKCQTQTLGQFFQDVFICDITPSSRRIHPQRSGLWGLNVTHSLKVWVIPANGSCEQTFWHFIISQGRLGDQKAFSHFDDFHHLSIFSKSNLHCYLEGPGAE